MQPRMRTAAELFEKEEIDKAEAVLKEDDMEADATNAKLKFDTAAQPTAELTRNIERCAGEYMLKARIVVSGIADESRYRQAVKLMSTAIDLVSGRLPEETLAEYLFDYAVLLTDTGQQTKALETWERLSGIYERLYRKAPQKYAYGYAGVLNNMAVLYSDKGDFDHCLSKYLKAIDIYDWLDREEPGIYDDDIARLKNNLGTLYSDRDEYNKALSEFNEAARIRFELLAKDNDPDSRSALADIYCNMATALQFSDHPQEALRYIAQAHAILDELDKEFPRIYEYKLYSILNREGSIYTRLDQLDKAEESLQKSLQLATNLASRMPLAHSADLATAKMEMSGLNYVLGKNEEARKGFCQALDIFRRLQTKEPVYDHPIATVLQNLGVICRHEEKYEDAEKVPQRGTGYSRKTARPSPILLHRRPCQSLPGLRRFAGRYGRKRPGRRDVRESGNAIYKCRRKKRTSKSIHRRFDLCMGRYSPRLRGIRPGRIPVQTSIEHIQQAHRRQNELRHGTNMEPHGRSLYALGKAPSRAFL